MNRNLMWSFETANFAVKAYATECCDLDLSWDEDGEIRDRLERGVYQAFDTEIIVEFRGTEIASDCLGQSIYERPSDFFRDHRKYRQGGYFTDMVREAIGRARKAYADLPRDMPELRQVS